MAEHIASVKTQTFGGLDEIALRIQELRLRKIREVAADYLAALKGEPSYSPRVSLDEFHRYSAF